ncbi:hypothetical protein CYLTODRAFT_494205 [Cylindrobasidium torrendii FP15055 ss-10]|uniref:Uncharacterized protein n=1 Tax=Cylindrobasidium torrendii FP15055 ss-10 TaxID=1314674 RepID=A0A0D7AXT5_9AGAR|nr:hypothetical protein CYLTODRAFT_494205 [Cylindrobasidium torrendii FP15055 ss-10]
MPSLRRSTSTPNAVRASPYPSVPSCQRAASRQQTGSAHARHGPGSQTSGRRVLADIDWWLVQDGQSTADADPEAPANDVSDTPVIPDLSAYTDAEISSISTTVLAPSTPSRRRRRREPLTPSLSTPSEDPVSDSEDEDSGSGIADRRRRIRTTGPPPSPSPRRRRRLLIRSSTVPQFPLARLDPEAATPYADFTISPHSSFTFIAD